MNSYDNVNIGIIGMGNMGRIHKEAIKYVSDAKLISMADINLFKIKDIDYNDSIEYYDSYESLLSESNVDIVIIATPNVSHYKIAHDSLTAGKNVLIEKPITLNISEIEKLLVLSKEKKLIIGYGENLSYSPEFKKLKNDAIIEGKIGIITHIRTVFKNSGPNKNWFRECNVSGGGVVIDLSCHCIELCRWLLNKEKIISVYSQIIYKEKIDQIVLINLEFKNGVIATIESSWLHKGSHNCSLEINGDVGFIYNDIWKKYNLNDSLFYEQKDWLKTSGYIDQIKSIVNSIKYGTSLEEEGNDGLVILKVIKAVYESHKYAKKIYL